MNKIKVVNIEGLFGIEQDGKEVVYPVHSTEKDAIEEWETFQKMNTNAEPHKRFLDKVIPLSKIDEIVKNLIMIQINCTSPGKKLEIKGFSKIDTFLIRIIYL